MKIKVVALEDEDYNESLEIYINGELVFEVYDGETEDNNLCRNFADCHSITNLMKQAYEAGKKGEKFELYYTEDENDR